MQDVKDGYAVIGQRVPRPDGVAKVTGEARYTVDVQLPHMLHGKLVRSPLAHARVGAIDRSRALKTPGVRAVLTGADIPDHQFGLIIKDQRALARGKVRFIGDEVAAVIATDAEAAAEAAQRLRVEYEELPAVCDVSDSMQPGAPLIHEAEDNVAYRLAFARGDLERALAESDVVVEGRYRTTPVHPLYMEPMACVVEPHRNGRLTIYSPSQNLFLTRAFMAAALQVPVDRLRLMQMVVGGGFGAKMDILMHVQAAVMALAVQRPVRLTFDRHEDFIATTPRVPMNVEITLGAKRDGTLMGKRMRVVADNGAYSSHGPGLLSSGSTKGDSAYRIRNVDTEGLLVYTNKVATSAFRGYGSPQITFALESQMDVLAEELGIDPVQLRLQNSIRTGDVTVHGHTIHSGGTHLCLERAQQILPPLSGGGAKRKRGRGYACAIHVSGARVFGNWDGASAIINLQDDGTVRLLCGDGEVGQGAITTIAQIAAEELGVDVGDVVVPPVDTDVSPYGLGAFASRLTVTSGYAARAAAIDARNQLLAVAASELEVAADDLVLANKRISVKGAPSRGMTIAEAATAAIFRQNGAPITGRGVYDAPTTSPNHETKYGDLSSTYVFVCQVADVEVDVDTGEVNVLDLYAIHDIGKVINTLGAEGQVEGGIAQGLGFAITEEMVMQDGKILNPDLTDYKVFTALDLPVMRCDFIETNDPIGPYGAKSIGESPLVPTAAAVANAVYVATGVRVKELPLNPQNVLAALRRNGQT